MNHAITIGGLLLALGTIVGGCGTALGLLMIFAIGMSDATDDGTGKNGCIVLVVGVLLTVSCIIGMFAS